MKLSREFQDEQQALERELALKPRGTQLQRLHWRTRISDRYERTRRPALLNGSWSFQDLTQTWWRISGIPNQHVGQLYIPWGGAGLADVGIQLELADPALTKPPASARMCSYGCAMAAHRADFQYR